MFAFWYFIELFVSAYFLGTILTFMSFFCEFADKCDVLENVDDFDYEDTQNRSMIRPLKKVTISEPDLVQARIAESELSSRPVMHNKRQPPLKGTSKEMLTPSVASSRTKCCETSVSCESQPRKVIITEPALLSGLSSSIGDKKFQAPLKGTSKEMLTPSIASSRIKSPDESLATDAGRMSDGTNEVMLKEASETLREASLSLKEASVSLREGTESLKEVFETIKERPGNRVEGSPDNRFLQVETPSRSQPDVVVDVNEQSSKSLVGKTNESYAMSAKDKNEDYVEGVVCKESEIPENSMKVVSLGPDEHKVLLVKQNGQICAMGTKCSHYGAPLVNGALGNGRVRCPWHGACFNIKTGDIEDYPGLDSIPVYNVTVANGDVKIRARKEDLKSQKRMKQMVSCDPTESNTFVIVGGGPAGQICAETLRQEGFSGKVILVSADENKPYDRVKLSKSLDITIDKIQLRPDAFYKEHDIEVVNGRKAVKLDTKGKTVELDNGQTLKYSSIFLATGSTPRRLDMPGIDLENVFTLRTLEDSTNIFKSLNPSAHVVVFGSSFIGMEAAAFCVGKVASVTVVGKSKAPFAEAFGEELGSRIGRVFTEKGVKLLMEKSIKAFKGEDGKVKEAEISDGQVIPADVVVVGLGVAFSTEFLKDSGVTLTARGSVPVNKFLETNVSNVYAGGDIAEAPVFAAGNKPFAIGHWGLAHYHGRIAALNMLSVSTPLKSVPFFWTMLFGTSYRYAGVGIEADEKITGGDIDALKAVVYYCKDDKVIAVATVGVDPLAAEFAELLASGGSLSKKLAVEEPLTWYKKK